MLILYPVLINILSIKMPTRIKFLLKQYQSQTSRDICRISLIKQRNCIRHFLLVRKMYDDYSVFVCKKSIEILFDCLSLIIMILKYSRLIHQCQNENDIRFQNQHTPQFGNEEAIENILLIPIIILIFSSFEY